VSFNINNAALSDSVSFANTVFNDYYPGGKSPVKNTSASKAAPVLGRTLSTSTVSSMINGDIFNRHPKYATKALSMSVSTSLNTLITGGASVASESFDQPVNNPETQYESEDSIKLTGAAAYNRIIAQSIAGKNLGASFVDQSIQNMQQIEIERKLGESAATGDSGNNSKNGNAGQPSAEMQSAGKRNVAYISELSAEENAWFQERLTLLRSKYESVISDNAKIGGFRFDIPNEWANGPIRIGNGEDTFFPDAKIPSEERFLSSDVILDSPGGGANAYICPALIEFLLLMHEKNIYIGGGLDAGRSPQRYYDKAVAAGKDRTFLSDHVFGRAIDIKRVGKINGEIIELSTIPPKETYDKAVQILIEALAEVPQYLLPDLVVVSSDLISDYGLLDSGLEPMTSALKLNKPYLEYINFMGDADHRNHIHLSFSGMRSGRYVGPGGAMAIAGTNTGTGTSGGTSTYGTINVEIPGIGVVPYNPTPENIRKNYYGDWGAELTRLDVFNMLRTTAFSDEVAAIFAGIIVRESNGHPTSCNPNALSGDFMSLGIFQINMGVGGYRKNRQGEVSTSASSGAAHGKKTYELTDSNGKELLQGWQIAIKNWDTVFPGETKPTIDNYNRVMTEKYETLRFYTGSYNATVEIMRELVDHRFWIPINQAWALYTFRTGQPPQFGLQRLGTQPSNGYQFGAWGDYRGKQPYGWISGVQFVHCVEVYKTIGKTENDLKEWVKAVYRDDPATFGDTVWSRPYIDQWLNGQLFTNP
jgi:hypothetical protein